MFSRFVVIMVHFILLITVAHNGSAMPAQIGQPLTAQLAGQSGDEATVAFAAELERIRQTLRVPGWSAAIVQDRQLHYTEGFGYADVENQIAAGPDTPYHLASVTKPIAATLLMQLVEEGQLDLNDPAADYGVPLTNDAGPITIWNLLTHTSEGTPGANHNYNGSRYAELARVISAAGDQPFGRLLNERFLTPLEMVHTAPNPDWYGDVWTGYLASAGLAATNGHFQDVYEALARPYMATPSYDNVPGGYPLHFSPAAGLVASVTDLARFNIALDQDQLLRPETKELMFAPAVSTTGEQLIYGLGWYSQQPGSSAATGGSPNLPGTRLLWHSGGWPPSVSALMVKAPDADLTFILLANNYNLTRPYPLDGGDVLYSAPALAFYKHFVFPRLTGKTVPAVDWTASTREIVNQLAAVTDPDIQAVLERELWAYRKSFGSTGQETLVRRLATVHYQAFPTYTDARSSGWATNYNATIPEGMGQASVLMPEQIVVVARGFLGWLVLVAVTVVAMLVAFRRDRRTPRPVKVAWLSTSLLFGPLSLLAYLVTGGQFGPVVNAAAPGGRWRRALGPTLFSVTGNMLTFYAILVILIRLNPESDMLVVPAVAGMFLCGWLLFRTPLYSRLTGRRFVTSLYRCAPIELASLFFVLIGALPAIIVLSQTIFNDISPGNPIFWLAVVVSAKAGALCAYPFNVWLAGRKRRHLQTAGAVESGYKYLDPVPG